MAANTSAQAGPASAVGLIRVRRVLAAWRQRRRPREAIPEELWRLIVPLARAHGVSPVAQALGLNYTTLKEHTLGAGTPPLVTPPPGGFLEVPVVGWPAGAACSLQLEDGQGTKLTLRLAGSEPSTVLSLAQGLWRQRACSN
jgi:hypothetical protein